MLLKDLTTVSWCCRLSIVVWNRSKNVILSSYKIPFVMTSLKEKTHFVLFKSGKLKWPQRKLSRGFLWSWWPFTIVSETDYSSWKRLYRSILNYSGFLWTAPICHIFLIINQDVSSLFCNLLNNIKAYLLFLFSTSEAKQIPPFYIMKHKEYLSKKESWL